jgi:hypothetical protein
MVMLSYVDEEKKVNKQVTSDLNTAKTSVRLLLLCKTQMQERLMLSVLKEGKDQNLG